LIKREPAFRKPAFSMCRGLMRQVQSGHAATACPSEQGEMRRKLFPVIGDLSAGKLSADPASPITAICQAKSFRRLTASMEPTSSNAWGEQSIIQKTG